MYLITRQTDRESDGWKLVAARTFAENEVILRFEPRFIDYPTKTTLRVDEHRFQENSDPDAAENFINHSCEPSGYIDFSDLTFRALRTIHAGEDLTYDYFTSDWGGEDDFTCSCGAEYCRGIINGFSNLPLEEQIRLKPYLSPFLKQKLEE